MSDQQNMEAGKRHDRVYGEHVGKVESIADPKNFLRVQVRVFGVFTDKVPVADLPWAEYKLPIGTSVNSGTFTPVQVGNYVWVDFPFNGDTRRPRITGSVHHAPDGVPNFPHEAFAGPDAYEHMRITGEPVPAEHIYHEDEVSTLHGVTIERNKDGSYAVYQRTSGTELTITKDGHLLLHIEGDIYKSATGNEIEKITGHQSTTANGGIDHDGDGSADLKGALNGHCICAYTLQPHIMVSATVKSSP